MAVAVAAAFGSAAAVPAARASSYEMFYTAPAGLHPVVGAVTNGLIYGTDPSFGGSGVLFTLATKGLTYTALHSFSGSDGSTPNGRLVVIGKTIYGTTQGGGSGGAGTVFAMAATGALTWSDAFQWGPNGAAPFDGLALAPNGELYGTTSQAALSPGNGTVFVVGKGGHMGVYYKFKSLSDGHCPFTGVVFDAAGNMYGTTVGLGFGGQSQGSVWKAAPGGKPMTQAPFLNNGDGEYPEITPTVDGSGNVWGVITTGTTAGAIWELTPAGITAIYSFTGGADGGNPDGPLLLGPDGNLYGTTSSGAAHGLGTVFMITPSGQFSTVHVFSGGADGGPATGGLAKDAAGHIFGGTAGYDNGGGDIVPGTIFRITITP
jgi:uncharacterized repeat protein (TIGR03803 family)